MNVFYIVFYTENYELNHLTAKNRNNDDFYHTRFITLNGSALYKALSGSALLLKENDKDVEWPDSISVIIRDNHNNEKLKQCRYSGAYSDDEISRKNSIEIAVDYDIAQFEYLWDMVSNSKGRQLKIEVCILIQTSMILDVQDTVLLSNDQVLSIKSLNFQSVNIENVYHDE